MDLDALEGFGWREALVAIIAMLALYVVVLYLRIRRLKRGNEENIAPGALVARAALAAYTQEHEPTLTETRDSTEIPGIPAQATEPVALAEPSEAAFPWNEPPAEIPERNMIEALEREVAQLRSEMSGLHEELRALREEQRTEIAQSKATQYVSPIYNEAMQLALQGHDAASISQHCGISRAEAELVMALVRNRDN